MTRDEQISHLVDELLDELTRSPPDVTIGDVLRQRVAEGDAFAATVLESARPEFLRSTIAAIKPKKPAGYTSTEQ